MRPGPGQETTVYDFLLVLAAAGIILAMLVYVIVPAAVEHLVQPVIERQTEAMQRPRWQRPGWSD